jgi:hypothetical protein
MIESKSLRNQAERCFRLARTIGDLETIQKLYKLGYLYEEQARSLEAETAPHQQTDQSVWLSYRPPFKS